MICEEVEQKPAMKPIDKLTFRTFINKFNSTYESLQEEQRNLLLQYIYSFSDDGMGLKIFLNEEIGRIKTVLKESLEMEEIKSDSYLNKFLLIN